MTLSELEAAGWVLVGVVDEGKGSRGEWREVLIKRPANEPAKEYGGSAGVMVRVVAL